MERMGIFGEGLYGSDFALDLRSAIAAVARLPFDGDRLLDLLIDVERSAAENEADPDHKTFWAVIADQFAMRGIESGRVPRVTARRHIQRNILAKPQPYILELGGLYIFPLVGGKCRNPYLVKEAWSPEAWSALLVIEMDRAFEYLAWYRCLFLTSAVASKPGMPELLHPELQWKLGRPGTLKASHKKRMELEQISTLPVDAEKIEMLFPERRPGRPYAISDITIANDMHVQEPHPGILRRSSRLLGLSSVLR